jgi:neutral ceramidase
MMKAGRTILKWLSGGLILILAGIWACVDGIDYRPYQKSSYYAQTRERWKNQLTNNYIFRGDFEAGFGRAVLTPNWPAPGASDSNAVFHPVPLAGYGARKGRSATGVHDDVFAKAAAFRVKDHLAVMVSADALIIPRDVAELAAARLKHELKIERGQIYFGASHSHASLGGWGKGMVAEQFAGPYQPAVVPWFADRLVAAVLAAVADIRPASVGSGRVSIPEFIRNRLVGDLGVVDPELSFTVIRQVQGKTAVVGSYSAHATVLPASVMEFSADYPGYWQRAMEQATGGTALFFAGGVGSHRPAAGAPGFEGIERMGQGLAKALLAVLGDISLTNQVELRTLGLEVALPELHARITDGVRLRPWLAQRLLPVTSNTFLQVLALNKNYWVSTPCDFSGELAFELKEIGRDRGLNLTVTSFNGDYIGYVIPHRYYHFDGYEPRLMSFFGPNVPDYFEELIRKLVFESK